MEAEREILSPTLAGIVKELSKDEMEMAKRSGIEEGKIGVAKKLIGANFQDEQISELTGLALEEIVELRKSL